MLDCISSRAMSYSYVNLSKFLCVTTFCTRLKIMIELIGLKNDNLYFTCLYVYEVHSN